MKVALGTASICLALSGAALAQPPVGHEFRVNTYTPGHQREARVAMERGGAFVVVWTSDGQDGDRSGIFGQRFDASGAPLGAEFRVNTTTSGAQREPAIGMAGDTGDFIVVWTAAGGSGGGAIHGQRFDASGAPIGREFPVNSDTTRWHGQPRVAAAADGRFVVAWSSDLDGDGLGVTARLFDATGKPEGPDFVVNAYTTGWQGRPEVAALPSGEFVVAWQGLDTCCYGYCRQGQGCSTGGEITARRYGVSGRPRGAEIQVNRYTTGPQLDVSVSVSPTGGFVVTWNGAGKHDQAGVFGRRFDASGTALGDDFDVNATQAGLQSGASAAHDANGNFFVAWTGSDGNLFDVFAQLFSASGIPRGSELTVNEYTPDGQSDPSLASSGTGAFVVVWTSNQQDQSGDGIFARRYGVPSAAPADVP